jgi:hypothetical protein
MPTEKARPAGATPKLITSESESSSRPMGEAWWRQRAIRPSKMSKTRARTMKAAAA